MARVVLAMIALAAAPAGAQSADPAVFEVASVKPSPPHGTSFSVICKGGPGSKDPTLFTCENMSLSNLVMRAYGVPHYRLAAPDWAAQNMFDLSARVPAGASPEQFSLMLQHLLEERFKLAVHHETRDLAKYELVVARSGSKLKPAVEAPPPGAVPAGPSGPPRLDKDGYPVRGPGRPGSSMMNGRARFYQPAWTMEILAGMLAGQLGGPVTDATGLAGQYEISLYWVLDNPGAAPPGGPAPEGDPGPTLAQAVQDQLGLRLELKKGPVDFVVIDHAEKVPVGN